MKIHFMENVKQIKIVAILAQNNYFNINNYSLPFLLLKETIPAAPPEPAGIKKN